MPGVRQDPWTVADVNRLIEDRPGFTPRYELVDGALLVTPGPNWRHQRIVKELILVLDPYLTHHRLGELIFGPAELRLVEGNYFEPDLFVVPTPQGNRLSGTEIVRPLLVCEVLSPGSLRHDRITKRRAFQAMAIPEYWIVDGDTEIFEIWTPHDERPAIVADRVVWQPRDDVAPFTLDVARFFASVTD